MREGHIKHMGFFHWHLDWRADYIGGCNQNLPAQITSNSYTPTDCSEVLTWTPINCETICDSWANDSPFDCDCSKGAAQSKQRNIADSSCTGCGVCGDSTL
jgi:hypothetical protein